MTRTCDGPKHWWGDREESEPCFCGVWKTRTQWMMHLVDLGNWLLELEHKVGINLIDPPPEKVKDGCEIGESTDSTTSEHACAGYPPD